MSKKKTTVKAPQLLVSQSMIKDMRDYLNKDVCGVVMESKYILKDYPEDGDDSDSKELGRYFEYILTGSTGRSSEPPKPQYMATPLKKKKPEDLLVEDMYDPYRKAHVNAGRVKEYFERMNIKVISSNVRFEKNGLEGTIDILALWNGIEVVIDIKYSGLLDDQWKKFGWKWTNEQKRFHGTQAMQYTYITERPFYFLVVSSTNFEDIELFEPEFNDYLMQRHLDEAEATRNNMLIYSDIGFTPYPAFRRCIECPIKYRCKHRLDYPEIKKISLSEI